MYIRVQRAMLPLLHVISFVNKILHSKRSREAPAALAERRAYLLLLPVAFAIKQKPLEIEFVRKVKKGDRLLGPALPFPRHLHSSLLSFSSILIGALTAAYFRLPLLIRRGLFNKRRTGRALENQFTE